MLNKVLKVKKKVKKKALNSVSQFLNQIFNIFHERLVNRKNNQNIKLKSLGFLRSSVCTVKVSEKILYINLKQILGGVDVQIFHLIRGLTWGTKTRVVPIQYRK